MWPKHPLRYLSGLAGLSPRARQIVICGNSRGGTTLFYNMVRATARDAFMPPSEKRAVKFRHDFHPLIITKRPLDVFDVEEIERRVGPFKDLHFVFVVRDPRSLVSSRHNSVPNDFFQGFDQTYFVSKNGNSFTKPGVVACFEAIDKAVADERISSTVVRYEDLIRDPDAVQQSLSQALGIAWNGRFSEFHQSEIPAALKTALNGVRPVDQAGIDAWRKGERARRVVQQFTLEPKLFSILERWGYETDRSWFDRLLEEHPVETAKRGRIVGFYTSGTFYEQEAHRMRASAERLALDVELAAFESTGSWVGNASLKARFLREQRRKHRGPLLYVDVDSVFHTDPWPYLDTKDGDLAIYVSPAGEMLSGTILINDTPGAAELLDLWAAGIEQRPEAWDQRVLQELVETEEARASPRFKIQRLPSRFCWIFDSTGPAPYDRAVIEHLQASRETKKKRPRYRSMSKTLKRRLDRVQEIEGELGL